jgi:hypothetical protein
VETGPIGPMPDVLGNGLGASFGLDDFGEDLMPFCPKRDGTLLCGLPAGHRGPCAFVRPLGAHRGSEAGPLPCCAACVRPGERVRGCAQGRELLPCSRCGKPTTGRVAPAGGISEKI